MEILTVGSYRLHSGCLPVLKPLPTSAGATMSSKINRSTPCQSRFQTPAILQGASRPVAVETAQCCQAEKNPPGPDTDRRHFMALAALSLSVLAEAPAQAARERRPTNISEDAYTVTSKSESFRQKYHFLQCPQDHNLKTVCQSMTSPTVKL